MVGLTTMVLRGGSLGLRDEAELTGVGSAELFGTCSRFWDDSDLLHTHHLHHIVQNLVLHLPELRVILALFSEGL